MEHSPGNSKNDGWETLQRQARITEDDRGSDTITTERGKVLKATKEKKRCEEGNYRQAATENGITVMILLLLLLMMMITKSTFYIT